MNYNYSRNRGRRSFHNVPIQNESNQQNYQYNIQDNNSFPPDIYPEPNLHRRNNRDWNKNQNNSNNDNFLSSSNSIQSNNTNTNTETREEYMERYKRSKFLKTFTKSQISPQSIKSNEINQKNRDTGDTEENEEDKEVYVTKLCDFNIIQKSEPEQTQDNDSQNYTLYYNKTRFMIPTEEAQQYIQDKNKSIDDLDIDIEHFPELPII